MRINTTLFFYLCAFACMPVHAQTPNPFSSYGMIQNVQNYSSNPFWSPNAPYNQRMPTPVYATGPDVETSECQQIVATLIATQCSMRDNCISTQLSDIRPAIMLQLSRLPGGNYATSCAGFIDTAYDNYKQKYGNALSSGAMAFPTSSIQTTPTPPQYQVPNPLTPDTPEWQRDMMDRQRELMELQSQNGAGDESLSRADFPATYADASYADRMANAAAGYAPYKDKKAYSELKIETAQHYANRQKNGTAGTQNPQKPTTQTTPQTPTLTNNALDSVDGEILFIL